MRKGKQPKEIIVLSEAVYHSYLGEYFLVQTDMIAFGEGYNAWGGLINPVGSNVNMFLNAYTISKFSNEPLPAEGWLSSVWNLLKIKIFSYCVFNNKKSIQI